MIPRAYILEWQKSAPWQRNAQVEQDLIICRSLIELFSDEFLSSQLAFRGGTALHKLFLSPQPRYSEDIDLVQIKAGPIKETVQHIQKSISFLGKASVKRNINNTTLMFRFESEIPPVQPLRLKIETNCREHFSVMGYKPMSFDVSNSWFSGQCNLITYPLEELLGTKLRALYQRRKGRDLYDIWKALTKQPGLDKEAMLKCYREYMKFGVDHLPTRGEYRLSLEDKIHDADFLGDTVGLLRPDEVYEPLAAYEMIRTEFVEKI